MAAWEFFSLGSADSDDGSGVGNDDDNDDGDSGVGKDDDNDDDDSGVGDNDINSTVQLSSVGP